MTKPKAQAPETAPDPAPIPPPPAAGGSYVFDEATGTYRRADAPAEETPQ